jgi:cytochrome c-type biogenesis protein CcmF
MTADLGNLALVLAWAAAVFAAAASSTGAVRSEPRLTASGRRGLTAAAALGTLAVAALAVLLQVHDFSVEYVWQVSSTTTPVLYLLAAIWGGQAGSLLFWSWLLALWSLAACTLRWRTDAALMPWFVAVVAAVLAFFLGLTAFVANPFQRLAVLPLEGSGMNPLLRHPGMALHPPMLYLGFTGLTIPFAFGMAALLSRRLDAGWILASRRWTLIAWAFLTIGLALGARWAYDVLGWGGYWGWDPVENAALMPWIAATALAHSVIVQERRGMFRIWNLFLLILTYGLVVVGTFLTRAGLVSSVHSFARSEIGPAFLLFTAVLVIASLALLWLRLGDFRGDPKMDALVSREGAFLANNLVFMSALFAVFWGTLFPLVSELVTGQRVTVGAPYFNRVVLPVLWLAILLMGVAPVIGWGRRRGALVARSLRTPVLLSALSAVLLFAVGIRVPVALAAICTCIFAIVVAVLELRRAVGARMARGEPLLTAALRLTARSRRRTGAHVAHLGIALLAIGVVGSNIYQSQAESSLAVGQVLQVGDYSLTYRRLRTEVTGDKQSILADLDVRRAARALGAISPRRDVYASQADQAVTVPAILHRPLEDVYAILGTVDPDSGRITVRAFETPLISLVWLGMSVLVVGTVAAAWPDRREKDRLEAGTRRYLGEGAAAAGGRQVL